MRKEYTLGDLMLIAQVHHGLPIKARIVGRQYNPDSESAYGSTLIIAEAGDRIELVYDDGRQDRTVLLSI